MISSTTLLLVLTLTWLCELAASSVIVLATNESYIDRIAAFGPRLTDDGVTGNLRAPTNPQDRLGCNPVKAPIDQWIALIERGECSFVDKVRAMQKSGALGVVVGDQHYNGWITMYAPGDTSDVRIPSVFVAQHQFQALSQLSRSFREPLRVRMVKDDILTWPLLDMLLVVVLSPAVMMLFIYLTWRFRQRQRRKKELAPSDFVSKLPVRKYRREKSKGPADDDHDECAICLEDYEDDDMLRTLPCKHEFHIQCVDGWLTAHKKFCPICKHDICSRPSNERTPLIGV